MNQQPEIKRIQWFTITWMFVEVAVALFTGVSAHSLALVAFGADSAIELSSASIVLWRFWTDRQQPEAFATKWTAWLLVALGAYIVADSAYVLAISHLKPESSYLGIGMLAAAAVVMPWLARRKRQLALQVNSPALRADAAENMICGYLAWIALAGVLLSSFAHLWWADSVAALFLLPFVVKEAKEAFESRSGEAS